VDRGLSGDRHLAGDAGTGSRTHGVRPGSRDLPEEKQQLLKENLTERIFGHEPPRSSGGEGLTGEDVSVVAQLFKVFRSGS
jgi:hypothetical protein